MKGITSTLTAQANIPTRFRSNSVPIPKIEVTLHEDKKDDKDEQDERKRKRQERLASDEGHHVRTTSLCMKRRKKSIISGLEVTKLKNFKSFVESKILSKSDRNLEQEPKEQEDEVSADTANKECGRQASRSSMVEVRFYFLRLFKTHLRNLLFVKLTQPLLILRRKLNCLYSEKKVGNIFNLHQYFLTLLQKICATYCL